MELQPSSIQECQGSPWTGSDKTTDFSGLETSRPTTYGNHTQLKKLYNIDSVVFKYLNLDMLAYIIYI